MRQLHKAKNTIKVTEIDSSVIAINYIDASKLTPQQICDLEKLNPEWKKFIKKEN